MTISSAWRSIAPKGDARMWWLPVVFALALAVVLGRVVALEVRYGHRYRAAAVEPIERAHALPGVRGQIVTSDGLALAQDVSALALEMQYRQFQQPVDEAWLARLARGRLPRGAWREPARIAAEESAILAERDELHARVAALVGLSRDALLARTADIDRRVTAIAARVNQANRAAHERAAVEREKTSSSAATGEWLPRAIGWAKSVLFPAEPPSPPAEIIVAEELAYHEIATHVSPEVAAEIDRHPELYQGVRVIPKTVRRYPEGTLAANLVGHVRRGGGEADQPAGLMGVERTSDGVLSPVDGKWVERLDRSSRRLATFTAKPPQNGQDVRLTIDSRFQRVAESLLAAAIARRDAAARFAAPHAGAALVALDVNTGDILAAASAPAFDPGVFTMGDARRISRLLSDEGRPLFDRAARMAIAPGSVFKVVTAAAILEEGIVRGDEPHHCRGYLYDPEHYRCQCFKLFGEGHAAVTLVDALAQSCNTYFFRHGGQLGAARLNVWATRFGFGRPTELGAAQEAAGSLQSATGAMAGDGSREWTEADALAMAIGQGTVTATPLQVARMMAAVANGGYLVTPRLIAAVGDRPSPPQIVRPIDGLSQRTLDYIRRGLERTVTDPRGTAFAGVAEGTSFAGKTGTAENSATRADHAWFAGYWPADRPRVAFAVVVEHGGGAAEAAVPLARRFVQAVSDIAVTTP